MPEPTCGKEPVAAVAARLQSSLATLCPNLSPDPHPRGFPNDREHVASMFTDPAQRSVFMDSLSASVNSLVCPTCQKHALKAGSAELLTRWSADFNRMLASVDGMLQAMLGIEGEAGEGAFKSLGNHFLHVNGLAETDWDKMQAALNTSHAIKTLASNLPFKVVDDKGEVMTPQQFAVTCAKMLKGTDVSKTGRKSVGGTGKKAATDSDEPVKTPKKVKKAVNREDFQTPRKRSGSLDGTDAASSKVFSGAVHKVPQSEGQLVKKKKKMS